MAPVIEVHDLHKRYRARDPWAVHGVSFAMEPGRAFGLLGPNGAGKSTVVKIVVGLTRPDSGKVTVFGTAPSDDSARAQIGFAPKPSARFPYAARSRQKKARRAPRGCAPPRGPPKTSASATLAR